MRPASGGAIQIAAALSICTYLLPDVLKRFQAAHPKVMITVRSGHSKEVLEMVLAGDAEIGLARSLQHPGGRDGEPARRSAGAGRRGPAPGPRASAGRGSDEVADQPLIFFDRGSSDWTLTHGLFRRAGLVPNVVLEVETIETAKRMVERGMGLAFLPHLAVGREIRRRQLVAIEIARRRAAQPQPRRDPPAPASALAGGARAAQDAAFGAQRSRRAAAPPALALPREQRDAAAPAPARRPIRARRSPYRPACRGDRPGTPSGCRRSGSSSRPLCWRRAAPSTSRRDSSPTSR